MGLKQPQNCLLTNYVETWTYPIKRVCVTLKKKKKKVLSNEVMSSDMMHNVCNEGMLGWMSVLYERCLKLNIFVFLNFNDGRMDTWTCCAIVTQKKKGGGGERER